MAAVAAGTLTWRAHPGNLERGVLLLAWLIVIEAGVLLAMIDLTVHRLPTTLVRAMAAGVGTCVAAAALISQQPQWAITAVLAAVALGGGYLLLALLTPSQIGMGDVRLAAVLGAALGISGWDAVLLGTLLPYLLALPFAIAHLRHTRPSAGRQLPFGPFLVAGAVLATAITSF